MSSKYKINGKVEKGPFIENGIITITELDNSLKKTNKIYYTKIDNKNGEFSYEGSFYKSKILVEANGKYFNEINNKATSQSIHLKAIVDMAKKQKTSLLYKAKITSQGVSKIFTVLYEKFLSPDKDVILNKILASDIQQWDSISIDNTKLPSAIVDPDFSTDVPNDYQGLTGFTVEVVTNSIKKLDATGNYQYRAKIRNADGTVSKTFEIQYTGFKTISDILNTFTANDIKQWDGITVDSSRLPSSLSNPSLVAPNSYRGLMNFTATVISNTVVKNDLQGTYQYDAVIAKSGVSKSFTIRYSGFDIRYVVASTNLTSLGDEAVYPFKIFTRSPLKFDTTATLVSHSTQGACSNVENKLLISSDDFINCDSVHVSKGQNNNYLIIPRETWASNTTYKIAVRQSDTSIKEIAHNGTPITFTTANTNIISSTVSSAIPGKILFIGSFSSRHWRNDDEDKLILENDGDLWIYLSYGNGGSGLGFTRYNSGNCIAHSGIAYQTRDNQGLSPLVDTNNSDVHLAKKVIETHYTSKSVGNIFYMFNTGSETDKGGNYNEGYKLSDTSSWWWSQAYPLSTRTSDDNAEAMLFCKVRIPDRN